MTSSVMPSAKYSFSGSALMFWKGSTATTGGLARSPARPAATSASANVAAEGNRSAGAVASGLRERLLDAAGTAARRRADGGTGVGEALGDDRTCAVGPVNGGSPASSSYSTQPRL